MEGTEDVEVEVQERSGWADSISRILGTNKPKNKKTLILSRAKKDFEIRKPQEPAHTLPVEKRDNEDMLQEDDEMDVSAKKMKKEKNNDVVISVKTQRKLELQHKRKLREWENLNRVQPDPVVDKMFERDLVSIATKGVVQLFNAVNLQQKAIKNKLREVKSSEFKKDKVLNSSKEIFSTAMERSKKLDGDNESSSDSTENEEEIEIKDESDDDNNGMTGSFTFKTSSSVSVGKSTAQAPKKKSKVVTTNGKINSKSKPSFSALHDDYMMSAKLKDWDKSDEED